MKRTFIWIGPFNTGAEVTTVDSNLFEHNLVQEKRSLAKIDPRDIWIKLMYVSTSDLGYQWFVTHDKISKNLNEANTSMSEHPLNIYLNSDKKATSSLLLGILPEKIVTYCEKQTNINLISYLQNS